MNRHSLTRTIFGAALLMFAACTQDELAGDGTQLPEGKYPLQIASVSLSAEVTDEPWGASEAPQTRVAESADGGSSHWTDGDEIGIKIGEDGTPGRYRVDADGTGSVTGVTAIDAAYWTSTAQATVAAYYPTTETVSLADQSDKLSYVLQATVPDASYNKAVELNFTHALAKVRVGLTGDQADRVNKIQIKSFTSCSHTNGADIQGSNEGWITMKECNYNGTKCWEANVVPGELITELILNGATTVKLAQEFRPEVGKVNKIDLGVGQYTVKLADVQGQMYTVDPGANVIIDGEGKESNKKISIPGGNGTTVTLKNCKLNNKSDYSVHNIQVNGDATIILSGTNQIFGLSHGTVSVNDHRTALYVSNKATLTIQTEDDRGELYIESGDNGRFVGALALAGGAALVIESGKITSVVKSSQSLYPGIGNTSADCGTITINGGEITATVQNSSTAPGIGSNNGWKCEGITINGGTVTVQGGNNSDYDIGPGNEWAITDVPVNIENDATVKRPDGNPVRIYGQ